MLICLFFLRLKRETLKHHIDNLDPKILVVILKCGRLKLEWGGCCCACLVTSTPYLHVHVVHQGKVERKDNQSSTKVQESLQKMATLLQAK